MKFYFCYGEQFSKGNCYLGTPSSPFALKGNAQFLCEVYIPGLLKTECVVVFLSGLCPSLPACPSLTAGAPIEKYFVFEEPLFGSKRNTWFLLGLIN